jgi:hypothetical protein
MGLDWRGGAIDIPFDGRICRVSLQRRRKYFSSSWN